MKKLLMMCVLALVSTPLLAKPPSKVVAAPKRSDVALTPGELALAAQVYQGRVPCELGAFVTLTADTGSPGYFNVQIKNQTFHMAPVETTTGAIRLEDREIGAVWLQLANKSMLMNQKSGQRLADVCMSAEQLDAAESLILNPAPSILDVS